jgi:hypothetical protein
VFNRSKLSRTKFHFFQTLFVLFALKELFYKKILSLFMSSFFFISYKMCKGLNAVFAIVQAFKGEPNEFKLIQYLFSNSYCDKNSLGFDIN